jgi:thiamine pyrophosphate-dependent acetolactate synthase large subunit-like protein
MAAAAFGCQSATVNDRVELRPAIAAALRQTDAVLIDVRVDPQAGQMRKQDPLVNMIVFEDLAPVPPKPASP